jgi:SagB-type dehydrogenase family enzyme
VDNSVTKYATRRPRLRRGLAVTTMGESMLIEGGPSRQVLSGNAALSLIPRMLATLDGRRSREQLCRELALSGAQFDLAVRLLDDSGLLEWVPPRNAVGFSSDHVAAYMSRTFTIGDSCPSSDDLARNLAHSTVLLAAPPCFAEPIAEDLSETGVGNVKIVTAAEAASALPAMTGLCAVAIFDAPADTELLNLVAAECRQPCPPVLRFCGVGDFAEVGPAFCGLSTACIACFRRSQPAGWSRDEAASDEYATIEYPPAALTGVLSGLVTPALLSILTSQPPAAPLRRLTRAVLSSLTTESREVVPDPECPYCAGGTPPADAASRNLLAYEWQFSRSAPSLEQADAMTPAKRDRIIALQRERDSFPNYPRHPLPDQITARELNTERPARSIDEPLLAGIFARVAGFHPAESDSADATNRRWAPSGGNLASAALYLVTDRDLFGLPGTIFRYDDLEHHVISIRADRVPISRVLDGTDLDATCMDVVIVLVGEAGRLRRKYGDFAWRLTHLDAGCAALQLHLVAEGYGLQATFASTWPIQIAELLDLDRHDEVVTAIAGLALAPHL